MTGIDSYSVVPALNATADGGSITWAEGQLPSTVNNSARQWMADERTRHNDLMWFQFGTGTQGSGNLAVPYVYASSTSVTVTGTSSVTPHHTDRRMKFIGALTGTIYGTIVSSSYDGSSTTINLTWDSGSLSNETLTGYLSQAPITGQPINASGVLNGASLAGTNAWTAQNTWSYQTNGPSNALADAPASTVAWDVSQNQAATLLMTGSSNTRILGLPTNLVAGGTYALTVTQASGGANALTYAAGYKWAGGGAPTLTATANAVDILTFISDGTNLYGVAQLNFH